MIYVYFARVFIPIFVVIYLLYLFTVILNKKKREKIFDTNQAKLIINFNKLDTSSINKTTFCYVIALANSFIVALTFTISEFFISFIVKLLVSFVVLIVLILFVYKLIGLIFKKKEGN